MEEIRIAVIGHGFMGHEHEKMLSDFPGIRLVGFADRDPSQLDDVRPGLKRYESDEALIHDPDVDTVLIAANNNQHHDLVIAAAKAGKNIICEKPVAMSVAQLDEMERVAKECGVTFTVHHQRRFDPDFQTAKNISTAARSATCTSSRAACMALTATCTTGTSTNPKAAACCMTGVSI